jgi:Lar family restriction alleviation protein
MSRSEEVELKPCPFCGGAAEIERYGDVRQSTIYACTECGACLETSETWAHGTRWNTRAPSVLPVSGWRDIATAPRDGTRVDLWGYWPEHDVWRREVDAVWSDGKHDWKVGRFYSRQLVQPPTFTHWMPLPSSPSEPGVK